jgi:sortase A
MMEEWLNSVDASELEDTGEVDMEAAYASLQEAFGAENSSGDGDADFADSVSSAGSTDDAGVAGGSDLNKSGSTGTSGSVSKNSDGLSGQKVLGVIQIKKIKVNEPIVEGVGKANLRAGIGHVPGTAVPGQAGNCALAGHRNYAFKKLFNRLDELVAGDEVRITTKKEELTYKVTGSKVVTPDDVSVLKGSKDKNIITLITCTPKYVASHRLIITAELTERVTREP